MPGGLPRVQRQHEPALWTLRSLRLLPHVGRLLQRNMHQREFGSTQLRRVRKRLPRVGALLQSGHLYFDRVWRRSDIVQRSLRQHCL